MSSSVASSAALPASFDPLTVVQLAMKPRDHDPGSFKTVLDTLKNSQASIYDRGLSAWAIGRLLQLKSKDDQYLLRQQILGDASRIMDDLVDIIGASKLMVQQNNQHSGGQSVQGFGGGGGSPVKRKLKKRQLRQQQHQEQHQQQYQQPDFSAADASRISKNCSLIIVMLSDFLSDPDIDPYDFVPPATPLQRMTATPEPSKAVLNGGSDINGTPKMKKKKRRIARSPSPTNTHTKISNNKTSPQVSLSSSNDNDNDNDAGGSPSQLSDTSPSNTAQLHSPRSNATDLEELQHKDFPEPRTYFKRTDKKLPDLLLSDYMKKPQVPLDETGPLPREKQTMNPDAVAGELTTTEGRKVITLAKNPNHPSPRTSVLYDDQPARDVSVPGVKSSDFFTKDNRLGYQVPRLYLGQDRPFTSSTKPGMPGERPRGLENARRPHTSEYIRSEFQKIESKLVLDSIRAMEPGPTGWYELPPDEDWKKIAANDGRPIWTPSEGIQPQELKKAWLGSTQTLQRTVRTPSKKKSSPKRRSAKTPTTSSLHENNMNSTSTNLFVASSPTKKLPYEDDGDHFQEISR